MGRFIFSKAPIWSDYSALGSLQAIETYQVKSKTQENPCLVLLGRFSDNDSSKDPLCPPYSLDSRSVGVSRCQFQRGEVSPFSSTVICLLGSSSKPSDHVLGLSPRASSQCGRSVHLSGTLKKCDSSSTRGSGRSVKLSGLYAPVRQALPHSGNRLDDLLLFLAQQGPFFSRE